jgi:hypothetical protein
MSWPVKCIVAVFVISMLGSLPVRVRAGDMDLSLQGLSTEACATSSDFEPQLCPNNELFEKLMAQFGITLAPPVNLPADSLGQRGFYLGVDTTVTFIDRTSVFWQRGVEATGDSISDSYFWYRLEQRKGLPFGFELGASQGYAMQTDMISLGFQLRWSLFEGFRTGIGQIPDFAVRGAVQTIVGSNQVNVTVPSLDFVVSKPIRLGQGWTISPYMGVQTVWIFASSEMIDLCSWDSGDGTTTPGRLDCLRSQETAAGSSSGMNRRFDDIEQTRWRMAFGLQGRYHIVTATVSFLFDLLEPDVEIDEEREDSLSRQFGLNFGLGMTY